MVISDKQLKLNLNKRYLGDLPEGYLEDYKRLFLVENADGTYSVKPVSLGTDAGIQMEKKYGEILKTHYPKVRSPDKPMKGVKVRFVNSAIKQDLESKNLIVNSYKDSDVKRGTRLYTNARKMMYYNGTDAFPFHHILPIGGETRLTTNDVAIITKQMNSRLSPYNRQLNDIADEISDNISKAYQTRSEGGSFSYLKKVDELNNKAEQVIAAVAAELPKKYQPYIGFTQLNVVTDEYGLPIDDQPVRENRIGKIGKKGIPMDDLNKAQLRSAKASIDDLTKNKTIGKLDFENIKNLFVQEATVPNSPICRIVQKRAADGGRIAFANGSNCAIEVGEAFEKNPKGFAQEVNKLPEEAGAFNKVKNAATSFLSIAKKGGRFGAFAAAGAATAGLVKEFRNDDPSTYLSNEDQQKNMLIDMLTQPVSPLLEQPSTAFGDAQLPAIGAVTAAGMVPGGAELYRQRTGSGVRKGPLGGARLDSEGAKILQKRVSPARALLGPLSGVLGKGLAATGTPLGMAVLEPLYIGQQIADGDSAGEIATNPMNYLGPAFAGSLSKEATRFVGPKMANIMRLGISPMALKTVSRRFGIPGLALSAGISGYEMYQNKKAGRGIFDDG
jgi:hypothetical protein